MSRPVTWPVIGWRPRGLRSGVTLAFALGALALSSTLALGTYFSARHLLVEQRERTALRQAYTDAALVRDSLLTSGTQVSDVLGSISPPASAVVYVLPVGTGGTPRRWTAPAMS